MARLVYILLLIKLVLIIPSQQNPRYGFDTELLHANDERVKPTVIGNGYESVESFVHNVRNKRDVKSSSTETTSKSSTSSSSPSSSATTSPADKATKTKPSVAQANVNGRINVTMQTTNNITTMTTELNDSHAQLMVHWLGEGTNVMLCLAREPPPQSRPSSNPSAVYISYNNGNTFEDKTYLFQINDTTTGKMINSSFDQFSTHPTYNTSLLGRCQPRLHR